MVVLCNIQVLVSACMILVILDSDAVTRRRAILVVAAAAALPSRLGRFKCPWPPCHSGSGGGCPGPADSAAEGSSHLAVAAARPRLLRVGRFKCNPGHSAASGPGSGALPKPRLQPASGRNLGRPGRAWVTGAAWQRAIVTDIPRMPGIQRRLR